VTRKARELETLLLSMFAAVPLYFTYAISMASLVVFHVFMTLVVLRVALGKGPQLIPASAMRWLAIAYVPFYVFDAAVLSRSAIAASTHLVLFIAAYQPIESTHRFNHAQRILTAALIFVASLATSTHLTIILFVLVFAYFMFRQLMYVSHVETARALGHEYGDVASGRAAAFYLAGAIVIGGLLFPLLPRIRNPIIRGFTGPLPGASTALSDTINFGQQRAAPGDATVVARVWMDRETRAFFTPLRLRGTIYDRYDDGEWRQSLRGLREVPLRGGTFALAKAAGTDRPAIVQMRAQRGKLFLPANAYAVSGIGTLYEGPARETYYTYDDGMLTMSVRMSYRNEPLRLIRPRMSGYPISPAVETLARTIVGNEPRVDRRAALIEQYMVRNFRYVPNSATAPPMSLEQFLLVERGGHCEYFAAGMVALLNAVGVPARVVGGFYGGQLNPITGYYALRREDAHAWAEVWDGSRWLTYDSTPASLRPGAAEMNPAFVYLAALGDSLTFFWDRYVLTFGLGDQIELFTDAMTWTGTTMGTLRDRLRTDVRGVLSGDFGLMLVLVVAAGLAILMFQRRRRRAFDVLAAYLAAQGIEVGPAMTMEEALCQLREHHPDAALELEPLIALYEEAVFSGARDVNRTRDLRRRLAELKT
jgi:protein-glutamine gamma-glutamyltransferase